MDRQSEHCCVWNNLELPFFSVQKILAPYEAMGKIILDVFPLAKARSKSS